MKKNAWKIRPLALLVMTSFFVPAQAAQALPTSFEKEVRAASKIELGQTVSLAVETCNLVRGAVTRLRCSLSKFDVTVHSFQLKEKAGPDSFLDDTFALDVTLENYSKKGVGLDVLALLRCSNSNLNSSFYADGINPTDVSGRSKLTGVIIASFPSDVTAASCENPMVWLSLSSSGVNPKDKKALKKAKKRKMTAVAYISLTDFQLSRSSNQSL